MSKGKGKAARAYWYSQLTETELLLVRTGYPSPESKDEAIRLRTLAKELYSSSPKDNDAPCCYVFFDTKTAHHARCSRKSPDANIARIDKSSLGTAESQISVADGGKLGSGLNSQIPSPAEMPTTLVPTETASPDSEQHKPKSIISIKDPMKRPTFLSLQDAEAWETANTETEGPIARSILGNRIEARREAFTTSKESRRPFLRNDPPPPNRQAEAKVVIHGRLPWRPQEYPFAELLQKLSVPPENEIHAWFTQILGTPDIDAVVVAKNIGLFVIELKNWSLGAIHEIHGAEVIKIDENVKKSTTKPPWQQAYDAMDVFSARMVNYPACNGVWFSSVASLFRIYRESFLRKFKQHCTAPGALELIANGVIFADDLLSGRAFLDRLKISKHNPVYRRKPNRSRDLLSRYGVDLVRAVESYINFKAIPSESPTPSDKKRLALIEEEEERDLSRCDLTKDILCWGYAGTGKTVLALQSALRKKGATLFTCFNKVLATDIRRLTSFSPVYRELPIEVYHTYDLIDTCEARLGILFESRNSNETMSHWAGRRVKRILEKDASDPRLSSIWNHVIVDESQDLEDCAWLLIERICSSQTTMFVIDGKKQQLYRSDRSHFLQSFPSRIPDKNRREKRRVFRTTSESFLLAQLFVECFPLADRAERMWKERFLEQYHRARESEAIEQSHFDFDLPRGKGSAPKLRNVAKSYPDGATGGIASFVASLLKQASQGLEGVSGIPSDILILVPFSNSDLTKNRPDWKEIAISACRTLGMEYVDYSISQNREIPHSPNEVRICTFHSCRGIEGYYSLVLGFESLCEAANQVNVFAQNLGYITLTRAVFDTDIVFWLPDERSKAEISFLREMLLFTGF
ncbi:nuclease-related domain-containing DEAD/DEAH box helicase [Occallatibacter savannae]|uniref:nuclease-related domain-containing DEAD/DEAH box helicase n=1 Tax=Occallatibacter savannae TaxID=1002691 RepID=UPI0013A56626|nr:NERD domain-containing protein [Occallatibacter savannae]